MQITKNYIEPQKYLSKLMYKKDVLMKFGLTAFGTILVKAIM